MHNGTTQTLSMTTFFLKILILIRYFFLDQSSSSNLCPYGISLKKVGARKSKFHIKFVFAFGIRILLWREYR